MRDAPDTHGKDGPHIPQIPHIPTRVEARAAPRAQYDPTYFQRHDRRNRARIQAIMSNLPPGERLLDIGCNRGYFSRAALDLGLAARVDGVEPSRDRVDPALVADPRFTLHEGDIFDLVLGGPYHAVIYCAVHHHVFGHRGYAAAFGLWQRIVALCERHIFFETGQLLEGSRWYWQRALRQYFPSDEQHLGELLQAVGPRLEGFRVIGEPAIHGTRRWLLRIDLKPTDAAGTHSEGEPGTHYEGTDGTHPAGKPGTHPAGKPGTRSAEGKGTSRYEVIEELRRSVGSRRQRLVTVSGSPPPTSQTGGDDDGTLHDGVELRRCRDRETGELVWCKRRPADPYRDAREYMIGSQVDDEIFIAARELDPELGLIFPYVPGEKLSEMTHLAVNDGLQIMDPLMDLFERCERIMVNTGDLDIDPRQRNSRRALIDLIDLHPSNILVERAGGRLRLLGVIDLEYYRNHNRARNAIHLASLLVRARARHPRALAWLARAHYLDFQDRLGWDRAPLVDRLYEGRGTRVRDFVMQAREIRDRVLRWRTGYWQ